MTATVEVIRDITDEAEQPDADTIAAWCQTALLAAGNLKPVADNAEISVRIVSEAESAELNSQYRNKANPTNVLSFPSDLPASVATLLDTLPLGDLVICQAVVSREAGEQNKSLSDHWAHMVIHGVLHLLGFDHQNDSDAEQMENLEIDILKSLNIADPYENRSIPST
ncbi:hypothetical protein GCM10011403_25780 [Pseudohongiella nitratireducens]|uniref:Endoribonuclease YbeY n=1 Tax=Pseudohongiella nitratireducens TaxID=1768907 RepID=A0A916QLS8_9GAMM|nr:rRNA maturation RNase YbeY [Pseudohongiella nitratireducens]GFZ81379.1 hypothetical protein GCM10011403_25780 [Pseudohongiella nitratireducens]